MSVARHPRPKELEGIPVEEIMKKFVGRFSEKRADWAAFEDAKIGASSARSTASSAPAAPASTTIRP